MDQSSSNIRNNQNQNRPVSRSQLLSSSSSFSSANYHISSPNLRRRIPHRPQPPPNLPFQYPPLGNRTNSLRPRTIGESTANGPSPPPNVHSQFHASSSQAVPATPPPLFVKQWKEVAPSNCVKLHRRTIRLEVDEQNPGTHLVTFTFDAKVDGSITIFYFAKEGTSSRFSPSCPDNICPNNIAPVTASFQKGMNQNFRQPTGTGIDLGFFVLEDLAKPTSDDVFPLVIYAEASSPTLPTDEQLRQPPAPGNAQITLAVIEKKYGEPFQVKVDRQLVLVDGVRRECPVIFGIEKSEEKCCVICKVELKDILVLPCRHLCVCSMCAKDKRAFPEKTCPLCRQNVEGLIKIIWKEDNQ